jgi:hypothetical protein
MTQVSWGVSAGDPMAPEQRSPQLASVLLEPEPPSVDPATAHDGASFAAGQDCGTRIAACVARLSALELMDGSRWWNRRGHRRIAAALVAYAEELESTADAASAEASGRCAPLGSGLTGPNAVLRSV